jgi:hypothetical protein
VYETYVLALGLACAAVIAVTRQSIVSRLLSLDPIQAKLAAGITDASAQGLSPAAVRSFWEVADGMLDKRGIRSPPARRNRMIHALRMCRERLSETEFEMARRMVRRVYVDI